jgi:NTP pyrophosphatase (non-canonical NTP hydrolase)
MGEACNVAKKIKRIDTKLARRANESNRAKLVAKLADEIADTIIYLDLLALREGIDLPKAITSKFNRTSKKFGFPERL